MASKWANGKIIRTLDPKKAKGLIGSVQQDNKVVRDFTIDALGPGLQELVKTGQWPLDKMEGYDVEFIPDNKGGIEPGTIKRRLRIL